VLNEEFDGNESMDWSDSEGRTDDTIINDWVEVNNLKPKPDTRSTNNSTIIVMHFI
jgi:hypothetical protein